MEREIDFHYSVMKWLHENNYRFFWEINLPNSRMRPDFLVLAPDGNRYLLECKIRRGGAKPHNIRKMQKYRNLLNDKSVKLLFVFPVGYEYPFCFEYYCEVAQLEMMYVPFETEPPIQYARFALKHDGVSRYFPSFKS